jgi:hypothetical protein
MKTLIYKIHKIDETGKSELVLKGDNEFEVRKQWEMLIPEDGFNYNLSCGWELNGKSLRTTLLEDK